MLSHTKAFAGPQISELLTNESILEYLARTHSSTDLFKQILGSAADFKEGDESIGVQAESELSRARARQLLASTTVRELVETQMLPADSQEKIIRDSLDKRIYNRIRNQTISEIKMYLLSSNEENIKKMMPGLHSDVIASVVKLMSNDELIQIGQKVFNHLPNSSIGKKGYLSARLQPNSSTDHPDDIRWQVFNGWAFGVGDLMLGSNPASSTPEIVHRTELVLRDVIETFGLKETLPWTVLSHIDIQNEVEKQDPGSTALWFQSIAGNDETNGVFGISADQLMDYARARKTQSYGLYLEAGQGSEVTNGKSQGVDMGTLESRKYGLSRALKVAQGGENSWMVVNDVAGFIGPEVFKTKEQLVRVALEDTIMGKLHGLTMGLDVCSTFHMPITPQDLKWAVDHIVPANPAYLMALPTQNDPMLSYNTTSFQEHVRIREQFHFKIDEKMLAFFQRIGVLDQNSKPTEHFGDPVWLYFQYQKAKGDVRSYEEMRPIAEREMKEVQKRGVALSIGHGKNIWDFNPKLEHYLNDLDRSARKSIYASLDAEFLRKLFPESVQLHTNSENREDYLSRPSHGETLSELAQTQIKRIDIGSSDVVIVLGDGLNSDSLMDTGHLAPYLDELSKQLQASGHHLYQKPIIVHNARVRVGYRIGEELFSRSNELAQIKTLINVIGERPGNGHNTFSAYISTATVGDWRARKQDHDRTDLISGISDTSLEPRQAARETLEKMRIAAHGLVGRCETLFK